MKKALGSCLSLYLPTVLMLIFCGGTPCAWAAPITTLSITSGSNIVTSGDSVASGSALTLAAAVTAGGNPVTTGQVYFCDASVTYCTDIHLLGTAQLTSTGVATLTLIPGIGSRSYKAVFAGTPNGTADNAGSSSTAVTFTVTGFLPANTTIASSGSAGNYTLTATVTGSGSVASPTGAVSFLDTSSNNAALGSAKLRAGTVALDWTISSKVASAITQPPVVADFNGDGKQDIAALENNSMPVLLGDGAGNFTEISNTPVVGTTGSVNPVQVAVGDFNDDGIPDAAVSMSDNSVDILLGKGDGTFTQAPGSPFSVGSLASFQAVGDFNGDGKLDLAVLTDFPSYGIQILLGDGDGTFTAASGNTPFGSSEIGVAIVGTGDFNGDGKLDIVTASLVGGGSGSGSVTVLLGKGDGTFTPEPSISAGMFGPVSVAVGDFNGDGKVDLAIGDGSQNSVTIWLGNGDGTFTQSAQGALTVNYPTSLTVGDFNGDGKLDLAAGTYNTTSTTLTTFLGNGDGTFAAGTAIPETEEVDGMASGIFNAIGVSDLAIITGSLDVALSNLTQTSSATATGISPLGTGTHLAEASYPGDDSYASSISSTIGLTAQQATPTLNATLSASSITTAQTLAVTVAVNAGRGYPTPTGSVSLTSDSYTSAATSLNNGSAVISIPAGSLPVGSDTLTVSYSGDSNYIASTGNTLVAVSTAVSPTFTVSGTAVTVTPGATTGNTSTITVTPAGGLTGNVALTASVTSSPSDAQNLPAFSFGSTNPVSITGTTSGTATLTISTTASTNGECSTANAVFPKTPWYIPGSTALACLFIFGIPSRRRSWRTLLGALILLITLTSGISACGGSGATVCNTVASGGTTAGTYTITVTGTSGTTTAMNTVTLTVQ